MNSNSPKDRGPNSAGRISRPEVHGHRPPQAAWGGRWPWTSGRLIRPAELGPLSLGELEFMRNEIYARHGWIFDRPDLQNYFKSQPWYRPKGDLSNPQQSNRWVKAELTPLERTNLQIIVSRERALRR